MRDILRVSQDGDSQPMSDTQRAAKDIITGWKADTTLLPEPGQTGWHSIRERELLEGLTQALTQAHQAGMERAAKVVNGLIGKDSGNWNRCVTYAVAAIRQAKEKA